MTYTKTYTDEIGNAWRMTPTSFGDAVTDWRGVYWNPKCPKGYQVEQYGGQIRRIAATSYEAFGCNYPQNIQCAHEWCERAEKAWNAITA